MAHPTSATTSTNVGSGFPYALRVIKIGGPIDDPAQYWTRKHEVLSNAINSIGSKRLRHLLGQHYANLVLLKPIYFSPVVKDVDSEVVDLTAAENKGPPNVLTPSINNLAGTNVGSRSVSAPIPPTARKHLAPLQNNLPTPSPSPVTWSAINHRIPTQIHATSTPSTSATESISNGHQTSGQNISGMRPTQRSAIAFQPLSGSAFPDRLSLQTASNAPTTSDVTSSSHIIVKTETPTSVTRQSPSIQYPIESRTPSAASPVLTTLSRTLSPLSQARNQLDNSISISKRKDPPNSVEEENNSGHIKKAKRVRVGDPNGMSAPNPIPGGVWGSVDAPFPPLPDDYVKPPPPAWLVSSLAALEPNFPGHRFHGIMLHSPVSKLTNMPCLEPAAGQPIPGKYHSSQQLLQTFSDFDKQRTSNICGFLVYSAMTVQQSFIFLVRKDQLQTLSFISRIRRIRQMSRSVCCC
ncbi:hypothetical protein DL98DRAFT_159600 [Cadophora sp. DSE1049]|nr:hypothetical protein DL98DRAFT_159600 [Cadophora sp. DSE1049]